jgi:hypothetical protein
VSRTAHVSIGRNQFDNNSLPFDTVLLLEFLFFLELRLSLRVHSLDLVEISKPRRPSQYHALSSSALAHLTILLLFNGQLP